MADGTKRIIDQPLDTALSPGDLIIVDSEESGVGTRKFDLGTELTDIKQDLGDLDDLATSDKTSLVNAINEATQTGGGGAGRDIEIYVEGSALVINSQLVDGNEVSY